MRQRVFRIALPFVLCSLSALSADPIPQPPSKMFNPNEVQGDNHLWVDGEVLYWKAYEDNLGYGVTSDSTSRIDDGHVQHPHFQWDWGFRLGVGVKMPRHDQWDLYVGYTYVQAEAHGHADKTLFPSWMAPFASSGTYVSSAKANLDAHVNIGDLELGRTCMVGSWLTLRPFVGVRGLVIDQDYSIEYKGGTAAGSDTYRNHMSADLWAVGLRMGVDTLWGLGSGFSFYGNGAASLLSSHLSNQQHEKFKKTDTTFVDLRNTNSSVIPVAEVALGIQWDYLFHRDRYHFGLKFGWEFNVFFDQNRLVRFVNNANPGPLTQNDGDLAFQGLTFGMRFDF